MDEADTATPDGEARDLPPPDQSPGDDIAPLEPPPPESPHRIPRTLRHFIAGFGLLAIAAVAYIIFRPTPAPDPLDPEQAAPDFCADQIARAYSAQDVALTSDDLREIYRCLEPSETLMIVEGLPGVSGTFRSIGLAANNEVGVVSVFSAFADEVGQCTVASSGEPFQTKLSVARVGADSNLPYNVITYDVGLSGGGEPFMGIVVDEFTDGEPETTINYVPSLPRQNAVIELSVIGEPQQLANNVGIAQFSSTFHNNRDYFPFTPNEWDGNPIYNGTITVLCGQ